MLRGIRGRWIINGIAVVITIAVIAVAYFSASIWSYYHSGVQTGLESKAKTASEFFMTYVSNTRAEYMASVYNYTAAFEDKDKLELQFVNTRGRVEVSSYGVTSGSSPGTPDIFSSVETGDISTWSGKDPQTGERIMAVSSPLFSSDGQVVGVMRYVTSLRLVDRQVFRSVIVAVAIGFAVVAIVTLSNLYFIQTITEPIRELTVMSRRIAEGSYGVQVEKKHDDEIGELIDTINEMSMKMAKSEKIQTEFISSVSHELRTPLTAITGWSETLQYDEDIKGDSRRGIAIISKEAGRLTKMVEELLEFTRIQDGRFTLTVEQIDVAAELEETIYSYRELLSQDNITLEYQPWEGEMPLIPGDPERLRQVFLNILDNAAKYGRAGARIVVSITLSGDYVVISIRDFGPGVPETELPHIRRKFYKGSSKERGSGIGLAVCDEIVTRHKGILIMENAEGGGLLVTVKLPQKAQQAPVGV